MWNSSHHLMQKQFDMEYIDNWSLWLDFQILLKTVPAVISARGAH
jgi:lipopolysaccharide/colanic/teichoic acid biosynthesis glycosyltransferase